MVFGDLERCGYGARIVTVNYENKDIEIENKTRIEKGNIVL